MSITQNIAAMPSWLSLLLVVVLPTAITVFALVRFRHHVANTSHGKVST